MYRNEWIFSTFRADFVVWWRQQKYWFDKYSFVKKLYKIVYQNRLSGSRCKISDDEQGIKFINRWRWPVAYISRRRLIAFINHAQPPIARSSALMRDLVGVYICHNVLPHRFAVAPHIRTPCNQNFSIAYLSFRKSECNSMATSPPFFFSPILRDILISRRRISDRYSPNTYRRCAKVFYSSTISSHFRFHSFLFLFN